MTKDDKIKKVTDLLNNADNITSWDDDGEKLDLVIEKNNNFFSDITNLQCPICETILVSHGHSILKFRDHADSMSGADIFCRGCEQDWYIHYEIKVPSDDEQETVQ